MLTMAITCHKTTIFPSPISSYAPSSSFRGAKQFMAWTRRGSRQTHALRAVPMEQKAGQWEEDEATLKRPEAREDPMSMWWWEAETEPESEEEESRLVEALEGLQEEAMMKEDDGREPSDYNRRAHIFDQSSRVFQALKDRRPPSS